MRPFIPIFATEQYDGNVTSKKRSPNATKPQTGPTHHKTGTVSTPHTDARIPRVTAPPERKPSVHLFIGKRQQKTRQGKVKLWISGMSQDQFHHNKRVSEYKADVFASCPNLSKVLQHMVNKIDLSPSHRPDIAQYD